jgi:hypothetical protein
MGGGGDELDRLSQRVAVSVGLGMDVDPFEAKSSPMAQSSASRGGGGEQANSGGGQGDALHSHTAGQGIILPPTPSSRLKAAPRTSRARGGGGGRGAFSFDFDDDVAPPASAAKHAAVRRVSGAGAGVDSAPVPPSPSAGGRRGAGRRGGGSSFGFGDDGDGGDDDAAAVPMVPPSPAASRRRGRPKGEKFGFDWLDETPERGLSIGADKEGGGTEIGGREVRSEARGGSGGGGGGSSGVDDGTGGRKVSVSPPSPSHPPGDARGKPGAARRSLVLESSAQEVQYDAKSTPRWDDGPDGPAAAASVQQSLQHQGAVVPGTPPLRPSSRESGRWLERMCVLEAEETVAPRTGGGSGEGGS